MKKIVVYTLLIILKANISLALSENTYIKCLSNLYPEKYFGGTSGDFEDSDKYCFWNGSIKEEIHLNGMYSVRIKAHYMWQDRGGSFCDDSSEFNILHFIFKRKGWLLFLDDKNCGIRLTSNS